ncbi:MAG TPA: ATP-binding protein [Gemmatimonadales bacterium]
MLDPRLSASYALPAPLLDALLEKARELQVPACADVLTVEWSVVDVALLVQQLGGSWRTVGSVADWQVQTIGGLRVTLRRMAQVAPELVLETGRVPWAVATVGGLVELSLDGERFLAVDGRPDTHNPHAVRTTALVGPSREAVLAFVRRCLAAARTGRPRVVVWGATHDDLASSQVPEERLVLPADIKEPLLGYLDRFWRLRERLGELGIGGHRGVLLAGQPGCGKTMFVRHLLSRYPEARGHLFIAAQRTKDDSDPFGSMLATVRSEPEPSIVVLEDIDRITESGAVTKEYLLNCLDGLLTMDKWVLWVATSNDPRSLEQNILDRPGRFDRVVIFPLPGPDERAALLRLYSPLGMAEDALERAVAESGGLSGAHVREACTAATLEALDSGCEYGAALVKELERVNTQHERARSYDFELGRRKAGFAA